MKIRHVLAKMRFPTDPGRQGASGVVGAALSIARWQVRWGHSVEIFGWNPSEGSLHLLVDGVRVWVSPAWLWAKFGRYDWRWFLPVVSKSISSASPDILHGHACHHFLWALRSKVRILHLQMLSPDPCPIADLRAFHQADAVICCSNYIKRQFLKVTQYAEDYVFVVHNGADLPSFDQADGSKFRQDMGIEREEVVLLYAGALIEEKGPHNLLKALLKVIGDHKVRLWIAGTSAFWTGGYWQQSELNQVSSYEHELRRLASELPVQFLGIVPYDAMAPIYKAADIVVVPSIYEDPHPTVVAEAMAAAKPVIGCRVGGITETILNGRTGFLVAPESVSELAEAIARLIANPDLRQRMSHAARKHAEEFSWERSADKTLEIYNEMLARKGYRLD